MGQAHIILDRLFQAFDQAGSLDAFLPAKSLRDYKFWPHVGRVDSVYEERNPVRSYVGMEDQS